MKHSYNITVICRSLKKEMIMDFIEILRKRRKNIPVVLKKYDELGNPIPELIVENAGKIAFLPTHLASASTIDYMFAGEARRRGMLPLWVSFSGDIFQSLNQRKKMFLTEVNQFGDVLKIANPNDWNGRKMSEIILDNGENLQEYHLEKWKKISGKKAHIDLSNWLQFFGKASDYYYHIEVLNTFFGVKFWPSNLELYNNGEKERLIGGVMSPAKKKVFKEFGLTPLGHYFNIKPFNIGESHGL